MLKHVEVQQKYLNNGLVLAIFQNFTDCQSHLNIHMQIKLIPTPDGITEWMAIELHGMISPQEGSSFDGKTLGTICWGDRNNVYMIIGNQTLEGKVNIYRLVVLFSMNHDFY
ncbi:Protein CBG25323 [Caenorhabditis briggsae]|uniref:Protein CBG25323 n=1 Tax=Caenorhabditis briggsae TaxID=6238 RepID=B6IH21_CAEBR|nr:Protein CBG25323 [Caenorhabditis briggsae]CAR99201.1 Protein CBG25323 [Caenorhabditis briggsae]